MAKLYCLIAEKASCEQPISEKNADEKRGQIQQIAWHMISGPGKFFAFTVEKNLDFSLSYAILLVSMTGPETAGLPMLNIKSLTKNIKKM